MSHKSSLMLQHVPTDRLAPAAEAAGTWCPREAPAHYVDRVLRQHRMKTQGTAIWYAWPGLHRAACRLAAHLGPRFPGERGGALAEEALVGAVHQYAAHAQAARADGAAAAFLRRLAAAADGMLALQVVAICPGRLRAWPCFERSIGDWLDAVGATEVYIDPVPYLTPAELKGGRDFLAHVVMGHREYGLMKGASPRPPLLEP